MELDRLLDSFQQAETLDALSGAIINLRDRLDIEHLIYHSVNSTGRQYAALTYSADWVTHYVARDYQRVDPVVQGCLRRFHPVDWAQLDWSGRPVRAFLAEALDAGVGQQGLSVPLHGPGGQFALFTVSDLRKPGAWQKYTDTHLRQLILAAHFVNQQALLIERGTDKLPDIALSPREIDALTFLATGLARAQVADRLRISEHTLRVYIESARFKLGAANTTHAVARALTLGLLAI